ncbi:MAG: polysulfide reductase NrfD [Chloroflexi bacterium]|nr:polysulfide reductase NrfD [Chloroflexota bacterium]
MYSREDLILRTLGRPSLKFYLLLGAAGGLVAWFAYAWSFALRYGLITTGLGDWGSGGGVTWGMFIGAYIWWIGIAHGGIIISAAVRLFNLRSLMPAARLAELLTIAALSMAAMFIVLHLGRPDRMVVSIIRAFPRAVFSSPLAWDVLVITLYFTLTATYVLLTIRRDLYAIRGRIGNGAVSPGGHVQGPSAIRSHLDNEEAMAPRGHVRDHPTGRVRMPALLPLLHRVLLLGYRTEEDEKVERMVWWLALAVIILAPLFLHGGVIPWLFAIVPSMPGWYGGIQGPTFLTIALTSALSGVIVVAYIFRRVYGWEEIIPDSVFKSLTFFLIIFAILFLWLQVQVLVTGLYAAPSAVEEVTQAKVHTPAYWLAIGLVVVAIAYLGAQRLRPSLFNLHRTFVVAFFPLAATLIEKTLFVVEGLMEPRFAIYRAIPGTYWPSWIELSSIMGTVALVVLFFALIPKVIPVVEVKAEEDKREHDA